MTNAELCALTGHLPPVLYVTVYGFMQYSGEAGKRQFFKLYEDGRVYDSKGKQYSYKSLTTCWVSTGRAKHAKCKK